MGNFVTNLFDQARKLSVLERDNAFLEREKVLAESEKVKAETKLALLEAEYKKECKAHNLTLRRIADGIFKQARLPQSFVNDVQPKTPPPSLTEEEEASVMWQAEIQRNADKDAGREPREIEFYAEIIRKDPQKYIV